MNVFAPALARARAARSGDDAGFMLIYVLTIVAVVATLVGGTLVVTSSAIVPSVQAAYNQAADAAAQGGLQAFIAYIDDKCPSTTASVSDCTLPSNVSGTVTIPTTGASSAYTATYSWTAVKDPANRYFRVKSVGIVKQNGVSSTKVAVGDVVGGSTANILDYGIVTGFESQSSSTVLADWPARTISLNCTAVDAADVPIKGDKCSTNSSFLNSINWSGSSPGTAAGKVAVCNATFDAKGGRGNNPPPKAPNPYVDWTESGLNGNNYDNYQPCQTAWGSRTRLLRAIGNGANGDGGYFSNDALLLSNSYPGGSGPLFNQPVSTSWKYTTADAGICGLAPGQNYRSFNLQCAGYPVEVGGAPAGNSLFPQVTTGTGPQLPTGAPTVPAGACLYAGPTRVLLKGGSAVVTSPQTTLTWIAANAAGRPAQCYTGATATGMAQQTVDLTNVSVIAVNNNGAVPKTTPAIAHGSSGWNTTGQRLGDSPSTSNSVFFASAAAAPSADTATVAAPDTCSAAATYTGTGASPTCRWSNASSTTAGSAWTADGTGWTKFGTACSTDPTDEATFACEYSNGTYTAGAYASLRTAVKSALAAPTTTVAAQSGGVTVNGSSASCASQTITPATATAAQLACMVQDKVHTANTGSAYVGASANSGDHRYVVTASAPSVSSSTVTVGATPSTGYDTSDPFFSSIAGTASTETKTVTTTTLTVSRQVYKCYGVVNLSGLCLVSGVVVGNQWGDGTTSNARADQFQVKVTQTTYSNFQQGTTAVTSFPSMADVTQYQMGNSGTFGASGPGDMYVEGTASHSMALVAADDLEITGSISGTVDSTTNRSTSALEMVGQNNVHVYHPVKCLSTDATAIAATDPGFCPNDITGLYSSVPPDGTRPDQQYVNLRPDLAGMTIRGAVFALGNADSHITCPQPPNGGGVCGGEFTVDNYARGAALGYLNQIGTLAMAHHSPVGQEWQIPDTTGQTSRPYSGYQMSQQYENLKNLLGAMAPVLQTTSSTTANWHILSVSTGKITGGGS